MVVCRVRAVAAAAATTDTLAAGPELPSIRAKGGLVPFRFDPGGERLRRERPARPGSAWPGAPRPATPRQAGAGTMAACLGVRRPPQGELCICCRFYLSFC